MLLSPCFLRLVLPSKNITVPVELEGQPGFKFINSVIHLYFLLVLVSELIVHEDRSIVGCAAKKSEALLKPLALK